MAQGFWHSAVATIIPCIAFGALGTSTYFQDSSGPFQDSSLLILGTIVYTSVIIICALKIGVVESRNWTVYTLGAGVITIGNWWIYQWVYSLVWPSLEGFGYDSVGIYNSLGYVFCDVNSRNIMGTLWVVVFLATSIALILSDFVLKSVACMWSPWTYHMPHLLARSNHPPDFGEAVRMAERVGREFEGDWKSASGWWAVWERRMRVRSGVGELGGVVVCPDVEEGKDSKVE